MEQSVFAKSINPNFETMKLCNDAVIIDRKKIILKLIEKKTLDIFIYSISRIELVYSIKGLGARHTYVIAKADYTKQTGLIGSTLYLVKLS